MIRAVQHVPGFVTGAEPHVSEVANTTELMALPWIRQYIGERFHRWCVSGEHLMVEEDGGKRWWVVARLSGDPVDLPEWKGPK